MSENDESKECEHVWAPDREYSGETDDGTILSFLALCCAECGERFIIQELS
jgi:hypothetical protein